MIGILDSLHELVFRYKVKVSTILQQGGSALLKYYQGNAGLALQTIYPTHPWKLWQFLILFLLLQEVWKPS